MAIIYFNVPGGLSGGGPSIFVHKATNEFAKLGHKIIYNNPETANIAFCIIESGKILKKINKNKTKVLVRIDGAYFKKYWHSQSPDRMWRPDMTALHKAIERDVANVDIMAYQSQFSKNLIDNEIAKRIDKYSIIHNGTDTSIFKPIPRKNDGFINLIHIGSMRNGYFMETLIGVYKELVKNNNKFKLILAGNMDKECLSVYNKYMGDKNIVHLGAFSNNTLSQVYSQGDIFLSARIGSSCDNTVAEAQSCGLPVICASYSGNAEMVINNKTGIIVDSGEWDYGEQYNAKMADAVEKIIPNLDSFKKASREHAVNNLSIEVMISKYIKIMGL